MCAGWNESGMNSRERLLAAIRLEEPDHVPLVCWCFGFTPPPRLRWQRKGREVRHWYTMRLEHIHTLPEPWDIEDDFQRVGRWLGLGMDDVLEVSPPWSIDPEVNVRDWHEAPTASEPYPLLCRAYETPAGVLRHVVRKTNDAPGPGWVRQPEHVPLFEDFNIPRAVEHVVAGPDDLPALRHLLREPTPAQLASYRARMEAVQRFARQQGVLVQGWSAFGMDAVIWLCGVERAVLAAMDEPEFFHDLLDLVYDFDRRRTEIMLGMGGVDVVAQRGWYSSTDFWSPALFERFVLPHLRELVALTHQAGALFAYTMTTGVLPLADAIVAADIDLLYFVDPVQDNADLEVVKEKLGGRMAVAGGVNSGVTLRSGSRDEIRRAVREAVLRLGSGGGFILAPVDALFPDTPWAGVQSMIEAWREVRDYPHHV